MFKNDYFSVNSVQYRNANSADENEVCEIEVHGRPGKLSIVQHVVLFRL